MEQYFCVAKCDETLGGKTINYSALLNNSSQLKILLTENPW